MMKELNLGLSITLITAVIASPTLAQPPEPKLVDSSEQVTALKKQSKTAVIPAIATPETASTLEFSISQSVKLAAVDRPLPTVEPPQSSKIEQLTHSSKFPKIGGLRGQPTSETKQLSSFNPPLVSATETIATNPEKTTIVTNPEKPVSTQLAQQPLTETQVRERLQQLDQRQQQLEQEINTLKQQLTTPTHSEPVVKVLEDQPQSFTVYAQPIFLQARPSNQTDFAIIDSGTALATSGTLANVDLNEVTALRVGFNYRPAKTAWTIGASYTFFNTDGVASATRPTNGFLFSTLSHPFQNDSADSANATTNLRYSTTDAELGYDLQVGKGLGIRLFSGLRFSDINQSTTAIYNGRDFTNGSVDRSNSFSGFGPRLGAEMKVLLGGGFSLFSKGSASLLLGKLTSNFHETDGNGTNLIADLTRDQHQTVPVVDLAIGLDWVTNLSQSSKLNLSMGYEYQHWFNVLNDIRFVDASSPGLFSSSQSDLSLQGFFIKTGLSFDF